MANCENCKTSFEVRDVDRIFYKNFDAPDPKLCPDCRLQKRLCFRNERTLYKRTSSLSGKSLISIYAEDSKYPVYAPEEWWSDKNDPIEHGREFDFSRPFFDQFNELLLRVPRIALFNINPTNSDFCQQAYNNKNCYLSVVLKDCEDCMYITHSNSCKDSFDCSFLHNCELCFECLDSNKLYACTGCMSCQNSSSLIFCYDCIGCQECIGCYGLRNKKYHIMNQAYSEEDYKKKLESLNLSNYDKYLNAKAYFWQFLKSLPQRFSRNLNSTDSSGNYLINTDNAFYCFDSFELKDCAYDTWIFNSHDCYDVYGLGYGEFVLEGLGVEALKTSAWNTFVSDGSDIYYSDCCFYSMYLFGCASLKRKKYCILNKQYSQEEYENLKKRIIEHMKKTGEWGEFFPVSLSPFAYNETAANYYFQLSKEQILEKGYRWREPDPKEYLKQTYILPADSKGLDSAICQEILACKDCGKNYKIMPQELKFYQRSGLPIPRKCPDCRYRERFNSRNPRKLWDRECNKCHAKISTSFAPEREEKVVCEECYKSIVS